METKGFNSSLLISVVHLYLFCYLPLIQTFEGRPEYGHISKDPKLGLKLSHPPLGFVKASTSEKIQNFKSVNEVEPVLYEGQKDPAFEPLISQGNEVPLGKFPFMASLQILWNDSSLYHICGASLVAPDAAITAAHCLVYWGSYDHHLVLGVRSLDQGGEVDVRVGNVTIHPGYDPDGVDFPFDIAVLHLMESVPLSANVQVGQMAKPGDPSYDDMEACHVVGWGRTETDGPAPADSLRAGSLNGISNNDCRKLMRIFQFGGLGGQHKCAWGWPHSACQGDSGGPLVCDDLVVGVTSWGVEGCTGCFPSVFTRVAYHYNWILRQI